MKEKENGKIKIVLADRDTLYLAKLKRALERKGDIEVVGLTSDGLGTIEMVQNTNPDVVILDILLDTKDGIWVLEQCKNANVSALNIVVSAMGTDVLVRKAIGLGADYYMAKPIQGDLLADRIYQLLGVEMDQEEIRVENQKNESIMPVVKNEATRNINSSHSSQEKAWEPQSRMSATANELRDESVLCPINNPHQLQIEISAVLGRMGIPASIRGYHFLRSAILMTVDNGELLHGITKGLYPDVGKEYKTTGSKVERAIRHAIESAWKKNGREVYFEIAGYIFSDKPTNGQFIADLTEYFRLNTQRSA